ncbi:hypothetical protein SALINJAH_205 [Bacillus phage SalinJah]|uniref:Uncharacterized protein n=1 Tax=Bacillus phage SalinJah TaxID=1837830 RepID=A0A173GBR8_9CAUD|nr:hypothetical protein SALINJAH_205 [Bacillus phage SalinJah]ANH50762.1 hypothetical protein SALINJAH_205 [Bacillus phage SalinJah]
MDINTQIKGCKQAIAEHLVTIGKKAREQNTLADKMKENSDELIYLHAILSQYQDDLTRLERMKRIADAEQKITDLDCRMLKMGARFDD